MIQPLLISPPFGNYLNVKWGTSIAGSFTAEPRPGLWSQVIKTMRHVPGGWVNNVGLRNPGIRNIEFDRRKVYSLAALHERDYDVFLDVVPSDVMIEINLGCPNVHARPVLGDFHQFVKTYPLVIVKLPPRCVDHCYRWAQRCYKMGVRYFHMCNTLPTNRGGESGDRLRDESIRTIKWVREFMHHDDIRIIGGGGIYSPHHVDEYHDAGADLYSISTACLTPWNVPGILKRVYRDIS
jgi:dihydroorotate dehydrogenase